MKTEEQWIHIFAFRYAIGRRSAAPDIVCECISKNLKEYTLFNLELFAKEIADYLADPYGDTTCWKELQKQVSIELVARYNQLNKGKIK